MKRTFGGLHQQLQQGGFAFNPAARVRDPPRGKLAQKLLEKWCWGAMSLLELQELAAAAIEDGLEDAFLR